MPVGEINGEVQAKEAAAEASLAYLYLNEMREMEICIEELEARAAAAEARATTQTVTGILINHIHF